MNRIKIETGLAKYGWKPYAFINNKKYISGFSMSYVYYCISDFSIIKSLINQKNRKEINLAIDVEGYDYIFNVKRINNKYVKLKIGANKNTKRSKKEIKQYLITIENLKKILNTIIQDFSKTRKNLIENFYYDDIYNYIYEKKVIEKSKKNRNKINRKYQTKNNKLNIIELY